MKKKTIISILLLLIVSLSLTFILSKSLEIPQDLPLSIELVHNGESREVVVSQIYQQEMFKKAKVWTTDDNNNLDGILTYLNKPDTLIKYDLDSKIIIAPIDTSSYSGINLYNIKEDYLTLNNEGLINLDFAEKLMPKMEITTERDMIYIIETIIEKKVLGINFNKVRSYYMFLVK